MPDTQDDTLNRHRLCDGCGYALYECKCRATQEDTLKPCPDIEAVVAKIADCVFHEAGSVTRGEAEAVARSIIRASGVTALAQEVERLKEALGDARIAIDSLDEDDLGRHPELGHFYRDELLAKIDKALATSGIERR